MPHLTVLDKNSSNLSFTEAGQMHYFTSIWSNSHCQNTKKTNRFFIINWPLYMYCVESHYVLMKLRIHLILHH